MRGEDVRSEALFSYVSCEARVPLDHPLRSIRAVVDEALEVLSPEFERLYAKVGCPSIAPEKLLRALLLQAFFSIRSELHAPWRRAARPPGRTSPGPSPGRLGE